MSAFPFLSLADVAIDEPVARKLPRHLAYYHRALPIAEDDDAITVVMAHPGHSAVVNVLAAVLKARVVPVRGDEKEIQAALDRLFPDDEAGEPLHVLVSSTVESLLATQITAELSALMTTFNHSQPPIWDDLLTVANNGGFDITVVYTPSMSEAGDILRKVSTSLLVLSSAVTPLNVPSMLCILRGHAPDELMLDWAMRFAGKAHTSVTMLAIAGADSFRTRGISALLNTRHDAGEHVQACVQRLAEQGHKGTLRLCQGDMLEQIIHEMIDGHYGLVAIAAEAFGDFVQRMLNRLDEHRNNSGIELPHILVVRSA